jgi:hypothetical protein
MSRARRRIEKARCGKTASANESFDDGESGS